MIKQQPTIEELLKARELYQMHNRYLGIRCDELKAIKLCEMAAEMGDVYAQHDLAVYYYNGFVSKIINEGKLSEEKELEMTFYWFMKAATTEIYLRDNASEGSNAEYYISKAQYNIGVFYENGYHVNQNFEEASKWYKMAAEKGLLDAQVNLSIILRKHLGRKSEAVNWCIKAAEKGDAQSQFNLGAAYFYGDGIDKDVDKAINWLKLAVKNHHPKAKEILIAVEAEQNRK